MFHQPISTGSIHRGEILAAFSYALDMTEGQPQGHSIRSCWIASRVGRALGLPEKELGELLYVVLLKDLGCSSNAARICELYEADDRAFKNGYKTVGTSLAATLHFVFSRTARGKSLPRRAAAIGNILANGPEIAQQLILSRCTRGADIARALRFEEPVCRGIYHLDEHWNGSGRPDHLRGNNIPLYSRIALLAQIADVFHSHAGPAASVDEVKRRSGIWLDPELVLVFEKIASTAFWRELRSPILPSMVIALAPSESEMFADEDYLDAIVSAFGQIIDAKSPFTGGHSERVADLAGSLAARMNFDSGRSRSLRRAAFLHDIGKLGVSSAILEKPAGLEEDEWVAMRRHADQTREILGKIGALEKLADLAAAHHERLDGTGYPRRLRGEAISIDTRIITVCDIYDALTSDRPYRASMESSDALAIMNASVGTGIDPDCFEILKSEVRSR